MTMVLKLEIGARVQAARKRSGLTQEALAAAINKTPESVSNIERGRQLPMLDTLSDLATALGIGLSDLVPGNSHVTARGRKRLQLEAILSEHVRTMDDDLLAVAVEQIAVLSRSSRRL